MSRVTACLSRAHARFWGPLTRLTFCNEVVTAMVRRQCHFQRQQLRAASTSSALLAPMKWSTYASPVPHSQMYPATTSKYTSKCNQYKASLRKLSTDNYQTSWQMIKTTAVARGCANADALLSEMQQMSPTHTVDDEDAWKPIDTLLLESEMACEMKLGLAHDILTLDATFDRCRPLAFSILLHVARRCEDTPTAVVSANYSLGVLCLDDVGITYNPKAALNFFGEAAKRGHALSMYQLAGLFLDGKGVKKDGKRASDLLKLAIDRGLPQASTALAELYRDGVGVPQNDDLAFHYFQDAVGKGDVWAKVGLATLYNSGKGTQQDFGKAFELNLQAATEADIPLAHHNLGTHYFLGKGVDQSFEKAKECFEKGAEMGFAHSAFNLANMYLQGRGCQQDLDLAKRFYLQAAEEIPDANELVSKVDALRQTPAATAAAAVQE